MDTRAPQSLPWTWQTSVAVLTGTLLLAASCNSSKQNPLDPTAPQIDPPAQGSLTDPVPAAASNPGASFAGGFAYLAGSIDFATGAVETEPARIGAARGDTYDLDATDFFTKAPCTDCVQVTAIRRGEGDTLDLDVRLQHPFAVATGRHDLAVFDVRGILILPGSTNFGGMTADLDGDGDTEPDETLRGNVDLVVSADGYTTRFDSRAEDSALWGAPKNLAGTMNPFMRYFDDPRDTDFNPYAPEGHNVMGLGMSDTSTWRLKPPAGGVGTVPFVFVVDAAYGNAVSAEVPTYKLPEFHRKEAWAVEATVGSNQLAGGNPSSGAEIIVKVKDWQQGAPVATDYASGAAHELRAASDVYRVYVDIPGVNNLDESANPVGGSGTDADPLEFRVNVKNDKSAAMGAYRALIAVRDELALDGENDPFGLPEGVTRGTPMDIRDYTTYAVLDLDIGNGNVSASAALPHPIIYATQAPIEWSGSLAGVVGNFGWVSDGGPGVGNLWRLDPNGTVTNLTNFYRGAVRKPVLNYAGDRVAFAAKVGDGGANWQIYTMDTNGNNLSNLSRNTYNDFDPDFLPDGRIVFASTRDEWRDPYNEGHSPQLYLMNDDGTNHKRLTYSGSGDYYPVVLKDGRISFRRWDNLRIRSEADYMPTIGLQYSNPPVGMSDINGAPLWVVNPDGTEPDLFYGSHLTRNRRTFNDHSELPDGRLLAVAAPMNSTWGAGTIAILNTAEYDNVELPRYQTEPESAQGIPTPYGRYRFPIQIADGRFVTSYSPGQVYDDETDYVPNFYLVVLDSAGNRRVLAHEPDMWEWMPLEVKPRPQPQTVPVTADPTKDWGTLACANIFLRDAREPESKDIQPIPFKEPGFTVRFFAGMLTVDDGLHSPFDKTDVLRPHDYLGEVPVHEDGSFAAMLPAHKPITWQVVDPEGDVIVSERFYTSLEGGEIRFCQGCHAPQRPGAFQEVELYDIDAISDPTDLR